MSKHKLCLPSSTSFGCFQLPRAALSLYLGHDHFEVRSYPAIQCPKIGREFHRPMLEVEFSCFARSNSKVNLACSSITTDEMIG